MIKGKFDYPKFFKIIGVVALLLISIMSFFLFLPLDLSDLSFGFGMVGYNMLNAFQNGQHVSDSIIAMNEHFGCEFWPQAGPHYLYLNWYVLLFLAFAVFGVASWVPMFLSSFMALLSTLILYKFGERIFNRSVGLIAGGMLAISTGYILLARQGINLSFAVFCVILSIYLFYEERASVSQLSP